MGSTLPPIDEDVFRGTLRKLSPRALDDASLDALWIHFQELRRWNPKLSLIGPGTADDLLSRHYGESLAALELLPAASPGAEDVQVVDVGSGGGFPGIVLAAAARNLAVTLVEPRQRKAVFLQTVARKAALPCRCLDARVSGSLPRALPSRIDVVTLRALRLSRPALKALSAAMAPEGRFLLWQTEPFEDPPPGFSIGQIRWLPESERRCIAEYVRDGPERRPAATFSPAGLHQTRQTE